MARIRLTKNELKKQKDDLARFTRFLPTLELKKQQLIAEVQRVQSEVAELDRQVEATETEVATWVDVFAEEVDWPSVLVVQEIRTGTDNVAGIDIPVFESVLFEELSKRCVHAPPRTTPGRPSAPQSGRAALSLHAPPSREVGAVYLW